MRCSTLPRQNPEKTKEQFCGGGKHLFCGGEGNHVTIGKRKTKPKVKHIVLDNFRGKTWPKKSVLGDNRPGENGGLHFQSMASTLQVGRWEESEVTQVISTQNLPHWSKRESKTWPPSVYFTIRFPEVFYLQKTGECLIIAFGSNVVTSLICLPNKFPSRCFYEAGI